MTKALAVAAVLLSIRTPASAHRLDEYLQATIISVEKDRVQASLRLIPGVAVSPIVIWSIDTNGDGIISEAEQQAYAERVLGDLSLNIDGHPLKPRLVSVNFPKTWEMKAGIGEIQIDFTADLPRRAGTISLATAPNSGKATSRELTLPILVYPAAAFSRSLTATRIADRDETEFGWSKEG